MLLWIAFAFAAQLTVRAPAFTAGASIPAEYTCTGEDASPSVVWGGAPAGTQGYTLIVDDPDAKNEAGAAWVHWVAFNIPASQVQVDRNVLISDARFLQGKNDFKVPDSDFAAGTPAWNGPCPPAGKGPHRYIFRVYALDTALVLQAGATRAEVDGAMKGHILAQGSLMARFER